MTLVSAISLGFSWDNEKQGMVDWEMTSKYLLSKRRKK